MSSILPKNPQINDSFQLNDVMYIWDGERWISVFAVIDTYRGATGATGPIGGVGVPVDGSTGARGATGPQGSVGVSTIQGATGLIGEVRPGSIGLTGETLVGATGASGVTAPLNDIGDVDATSPSNGQILRYNSFTNNYVISDSEIPPGSLIPTLDYTEILLGTDFKYGPTDGVTNGFYFGISSTRTTLNITPFPPSSSIDVGDILEISRPDSGLPPIRYVSLYSGLNNFPVLNSPNYNINQLSRLGELIINPDEFTLKVIKYNKTSLNVSNYSAYSLEIPTTSLFDADNINNTGGFELRNSNNKVTSVESDSPPRLKPTNQYYTMEIDDLGNVSSSIE